MLMEHPSGALFIAGYGSNDPNDIPKLWKSVDHGNTWSRVNVGKQADGAIGNSDVDLAVSWQWSVLSRERKVDRPWVKTAADGRVYVIWNDGRTVQCRVSSDRGVHWMSSTVSVEGGGSSHLTVGPRGQVAVRLTPVSQSGLGYTEGLDLIAVSTDSGMHWVKYPAPGTRDWVLAPKTGSDATSRWVEPLAWSNDGTLYSLWTTKDAVWLAGSSSGGGPWATWKVAACSEVCYFPYLVAHGKELAATWTSGREEKQAFHVARLTMGDAGPKTVAESTPIQLEIWTNGEKPTDPQQRDTGGEYYAAAFLRDGKLGVVTPVRNKEKTKFGFTFWSF